MLAAFTIPVITNLAIGYFDADGELGLQLGKLLQVMIIVLVPVALGMVVRRFSRSFAERADRPVRIFFSIVVLVVLGARLLKLGAPQAIAVSMEIGIHNTTIALTIALSVLNSIEVAIAGRHLFDPDVRPRYGIRLRNQPGNSHRNSQGATVAGLAKSFG